MKTQPSIRRRTFLQAASIGAALALRPFRLPAAGEAFAFDPRRELIPAPRDPAEWPSFREKLAQWRAEARASLRYDGALYRREDFAWVPSCFSCAFIMLCDELFFDHRTGRPTHEAFLEHGLREFGGYDAAVLWQAYPRIGLDDRNQFDFYRDMPGGLAGLREIARALRRRGTRVFIDYNPWDTGTRRERKADLDALADMVRAIEADGIFLDTMDRGAADFRSKLDAVRPGVVLEGEGALPLERIHDHHMSWAQWFPDGEVPGVLRNKWFERRHLQHQIQRWNRDHSSELHAAWMNGSGIMVWENVFGTWNGWCPRDRSILRSMLPIQRRHAAVFSGERWTPLVPAEAPAVFASLWEGEGLRLWTLVNRAGTEAKGNLLRIERRSGESFFDLIAGTEAEVAAAGSGHTLLAGSIPPRGIGCFLGAAPEALGADFSAFIASQKALAARVDRSAAFPGIEAVLRPAEPARRHKKGEIPADMALIPAASFRMKVEFRVRECGFYESSPPHFAGPGGHSLHHPMAFERDASLRPYAIDLAPVTNARFREFLEASGYRPKHPENFLKHWSGGAPPPGKEDHPVVYVDLEDARAFARWAGKRLPTEEEWQHAAAGPQGLRYPWGNEWLPGRANGGESGGTTPVKAFPEGRSPFGCYDLCGNVWEWTESERSDGRTRFAIIRGGSFYRARGSDWYMDGGPRPNDFACKFLLLWPGLDRCATIGFRCAADID